MGLLGPLTFAVALPDTCAEATPAAAAAKAKAHTAFLMFNAMMKSTLPQTA
jgi:hypothetical protein